MITHFLLRFSAITLVVCHLNLAINYATNSNLAHAEILAVATAYHLDVAMNQADALNCTVISEDLATDVIIDETVEYDDLADAGSTLTEQDEKGISWIPYTVEANGILVIEVSSDDFDSIAHLRFPDGERITVDDCGLDRDSIIIAQVSPGEYQIGIDSYNQTANSNSNYSLETTFYNTQDIIPVVQGETITYDINDARIFSVLVAESNAIVAEARSSTADTVLIGGNAFGTYYNDDFNNSTNSQVNITAEHTTDYYFITRTYDGTDTGQATFRTNEATQLSEGDEVDDRGCFVDWSVLEIEANTLLQIDLSAAFDTYLYVELPNGETIFNDDTYGTDSSLTYFATDNETLRIGASSFGTQTGVYTLTVEQETGFRTTQLTADGTYFHNLTDTDPNIEGKYLRAYQFNGQQGQIICIDQSSDDLDTYLRLLGPNGIDIVNDDRETGDTNSRVALRLQQDGLYTIMASTFDSDETGDYQLCIDFDASPYNLAEFACAGGETRGVFVGIADYEGTNNDLDYCDSDAENIYNSSASLNLLREESLLLTNEDATADNILAALRKVVKNSNPNDCIIFFYSGHGGQNSKDDISTADPDGRDEYLMSYEGDITDNEIAEILNNASCHVIITIDACHSGGFARDLCSVPNRLGFFSSEGDCLSLVAERYNSGGYLSHFFNESLQTPFAMDLNGDNMVTAHEWIYHIQQLFAENVNNAHAGMESSDGTFPSDNAIEPSNNRLSLQQVVCDRESLSPHTIYFSKE